MYIDKLDSKSSIRTELYATGNNFRNRNEKSKKNNNNNNNNLDMEFMILKQF